MVHTLSFRVRCCFGPWSKGSFWYTQKDRGVVLVHKKEHGVILVLKKGRGVILVHKKGQRCCFGAGYVRGVVSVHTCMLHYPDLNTKLLSIKKYEV